MLGPLATQPVSTRFWLAKWTQFFVWLDSPRA